MTEKEKAAKVREVAVYRKDGMTVKDACEEAGIALHQYYTWGKLPKQVDEIKEPHTITRPVSNSGRWVSLEEKRKDFIHNVLLCSLNGDSPAVFAQDLEGLSDDAAYKGEKLGQIYDVLQDWLVVPANMTVQFQSNQTE